ncbi:GCN5 family acetyltransferase [Streptomyces sp. 150FB]|uniref:GNAT family N-acetyltransferase n=1 Tax=Streptomyces sp. 150FB TaxID=1576605 RepID=UPI00058964DC|nr:GNAT family N-acetyltransferase [Streptomyces sp. 150FB]KIF77507.1 GCN5 family acetyltransferase [Streptomyces sp. 150FB]
MRIRPATVADLPLLQEIEVAGGEAFRTVGMGEIADHAPPPLDVLDSYRLAGHAWVTDDGTGRPVAYLIHDDVDGAAHIEQLTVHPSAAHRRLGSALIDHLAAHATGTSGLTLTTFAEVPWNAPYYARLGFRTLTEAELTDGLREIRRAEAAHGLDAWPRVCMRREV